MKRLYIKEELDASESKDWLYLLKKIGDADEQIKGMVNPILATIERMIVLPASFVDLITDTELRINGIPNNAPKDTDSSIQDKTLLALMLAVDFLIIESKKGIVFDAETIKVFLLRIITENVASSLYNEEQKIFYTLDKDTLSRIHDRTILESTALNTKLKEMNPDLPRKIVDFPKTDKTGLSALLSGPYSFFNIAQYIIDNANDDDENHLYPIYNMLSTMDYKDGKFSYDYNIPGTKEFLSELDSMSVNPLQSIREELAKRLSALVQKKKLLSDKSKLNPEIRKRINYILKKLYFINNQKGDIDLNDYYNGEQIPFNDVCWFLLFLNDYDITKLARYLMSPDFELKSFFEENPRNQENMIAIEDRNGIEFYGENVKEPLNNQNYKELNHELTITLRNMFEYMGFDEDEIEIDTDDDLCEWVSLSLYGYANHICKGRKLNTFGKYNGMKENEIFYIMMGASDQLISYCGRLLYDINIGLAERRIKAYYFEDVSTRNNILRKLANMLSKEIFSMSSSDALSVIFIFANKSPYIYVDMARLNSTNLSDRLKEELIDFLDGESKAISFVLNRE